MTPGARRLVSRDGVGHTFDSGSFALELLLTGGPPPWDRYELWHTPDDLADWLAGSHLAAELPLATGEVRVTEEELEAARKFRDALFRIAPTLALRNDKGKPMPGVGPMTAADVELVNAAVGPVPRPVLDADGTKVWELPITGAQVLSLAARELIDLIGTDSGKRVRMCEGDNCYLLFHDTSRPGNRRWCSMQRCGNRHKVGNYRSRH
ncbi:CGNR zinc finger domain-containing protein [Kribbella amoyensis]|nr:CGNR zinc finger domain-containing protein [Kribbella amoyensis]